MNSIGRAIQMEQFFFSLTKVNEGYENFEKESWAFKHDRLRVEKRLENGGEVKTSGSCGGVALSS
jgi:hypothetical protein